MSGIYKLISCIHFPTIKQQSGFYFPLSISNMNADSVNMKFEACWKLESKNIGWLQLIECKFTQGSGFYQSK